MYRDHKIVAVIPAGRKRVLKMLFKYLRANSDIIDYVQVWENTQQQEDLEYIHSQADDFLRPVPLPTQFKFIANPVQHNTGRFYLNTTDEDTIYIRFDDDIVYIHPEAIKNLVDFTLDNEEYFIVFANIWNNAIISYIHQHIYENIGKEYGVVEELYCMDEVGWKSPEFAEYIHNILLDHIEKGTTEELFFDKYELDNVKFSISCFAFRGKDFAKFHGFLGRHQYGNNPGSLDEELWLTQNYPNEHGLKNAICGSALVSHLTFFPQKRHLLDNTDIQDRYYELAKQLELEGYYDGLKKQQEEEGRP